jgi:hypothetical protein
MQNSSILITLLLNAAAVLSAQNWEVGGSVGYNRTFDVKVVRDGVSGETGFKSGVAFGGLLGNDVTDRIGGEVRYTFMKSDLRVSSGSVEATAAAQSHALHYDFLVHAAPRGESVRPFAAFGAGVKYLRGTGVEPVFQPLSSLVVLTHTNEALPVISAGGGLKFSLSRRVLARIDFRDYMTPYPNALLALPPNSRAGGWMHNLVVMVGISGLF